MDDIDLLVVGPTGGKSGGIGRYISEQLRHLDNRLSVRLYNTKTASSDSPIGFVRGMLGALMDWIRYPLQSRPDVVHVHTSHYFSFYLSSMYVLFSAYVWNRPVVVHVHGSSFDEFIQDASGPLAAFQSLVFDASDVVVVLSEYWRDTLSARVAEQKLVVLPNAVAVEEYDPDPSTETQHLVFVSSHVERKGIVEATEGVAALHDRDIKFRTTIAGTGPLSHHAEAVATEFDDVEYTGYVSESRKRELLNQATVYVLPTHAEGLPIAILEAMAGGNAIVSTDVGSIPAVVDEHNGAIVPPGDVDALTDALERVLTDPQRTRQLCEESRARAEASYAWEDIADELVALYERLTGTGVEHDRLNVPEADGIEEG